MSRSHADLARINSRLYRTLQTHILSVRKRSYRSVRRIDRDRPGTGALRRGLCAREGHDAAVLRLSSRRVVLVREVVVGEHRLAARQEEVEPTGLES